MFPRTIHKQAGSTSSPWSLAARLKYACWLLVRTLLFRPTPKFLWRFRNLLLRIFGADVHPTAFISQSAVVRMPWHFSIGGGACIGEHAEIYNLGHVTIGAKATVAQHSYLCAGTHDFEDPILPLVTAPIAIGEECFIGAKAIVMLGVSVGARSIVGAGAVVAKDLPPDSIAVGNPAKVIRNRTPIGGQATLDAPRE